MRALVWWSLVVRASIRWEIVGGWCSRLRSVVAGGGLPISSSRVSVEVM